MPSGGVHLTPIEWCYTFQSTLRQSTSLWGLYRRRKINGFRWNFSHCGKQVLTEAVNYLRARTETQFSETVSYSFWKTFLLVFFYVVDVLFTCMPRHHTSVAIVSWNVCLFLVLNCWAFDKMIASWTCFDRLTRVPYLCEGLLI